MKDLDKIVFTNLFKAACEKCFGSLLVSPLSETDSKLLSNEIYEHTGLVIGAKSIKNYSIYILGDKNLKRENPSVATLDTLARYVLGAPNTDEVQRKNNESHYPYWFQYKHKFANDTSMFPRFHLNLKKAGIILIIIVITVVGLIILKSFNQKNKNLDFTDNFNSVDEDSLANRGWIVKSGDTIWWNKRNEKTGHLSLFTLKGDNWGNIKNRAGIKNLIMRSVTSDCFMAEIHFTGFIPKCSWQQAGILLSDDTSFNNKTLRLSISYNDFFGGYRKSPEILIQVLSSAESGNLSKPEEVAHVTLFSIEPGNEKLVENNLAKSALKIEKKGNRFRFLYNSGSTESFAFKEIVSREFDVQIKYIGLFAIQGWVETENNIPAYFDSFSLANIVCGK